jgi:hypothetical protein
MSTGGDGEQNQQLSYLGISTPPTPTIANLSAAQDIVTTNDFTLSWNSLAGGLIPKVVMLTVLDRSNTVVYSSPAPFTDGALDGSATSVTFTNGMLPPGETLLGHLVVFQPAIPNTNYATGVIGLLRDTAFPLVTRALPPAAPAHLTALAFTNRTLVMQMAMEPNRAYRVEGSENLTNWVTLLVTNTPHGKLLFTQPANHARWFYRAVAP